MRHVRVHGAACALALALCASAIPARAHGALADPAAPPALEAAASNERAEAIAASGFSGDPSGLFTAVDGEPADHVLGLAMIMADVFAIASGRDGLGPAEKYTAAGALARVEASAVAVLETGVADVARDGGLVAGAASPDPAALVAGATPYLAASSDRGDGPGPSGEAPESAALVVDNDHTLENVALPAMISFAVNNRPSPMPLQAVQIERAFTPASGPSAPRPLEQRHDAPFNVAADGGDPAGAINAN